MPKYSNRYFVSRGYTAARGPAHFHALPQIVMSSSTIVFRVTRKTWLEFFKHCCYYLTRRLDFQCGWLLSAYVAAAILSAKVSEIMPAAAYKAAIAFGMVYIPVSLYTAVNETGISFNQLSADGKSRIQYKKVRADNGQEVSP